MSDYLETVRQAIEEDLEHSIAELIGPATAAIYAKTRDAARRFLALTETGPDYEAAIDRAIDVLPWEHEIDNFVRGEYDDWLRTIVDAAVPWLSDYTEEET